MHVSRSSNPTATKWCANLLPRSDIIGWRYSTNSDFQDAVRKVDNELHVGE